MKSSDRNSTKSNDCPPRVSSWLQNGFHRFLERYLAKNFDAVGIEASSLDLLEQIRAGDPLIIYANHPSWWDPMIAHLLNRRLFPDRQFYAPIDAQALQRYQVLKRLGFYGVELGSMSGVRTFLQTSDRIATAGNTAIWITPEGQFTDPRDHDGGWQPGLAHLCNRLDRGHVVPIALEYCFWDEPRPVCLTSVGPPISITSLRGHSKETRNKQLIDQLRSTQNKLRSLVVPRNPQPFKMLLSGRSGPSGLYGRLRKLKSILGGRSVDQRHGGPLQ